MPTPLLDNRQLGPDTARLSLLVNGSFENWQRGTTFGPLSTAAFTADRWMADFSRAGASGTISRMTSGTSVLNAQVTLGANPAYIFQSLRPADGNQFQALRGLPVTLSADVWADSPQNGIGITSDGTGGSTVITLHPGDSTWRRLAVTYVVPSDFTSLNVHALAMSASGRCIVGRAMLVVGTQAADYAPLHPADDLARCLRYYQIIGTPSSGTTVTLAVGQVLSATQAQIALSFVQKPVAPTVTVVGSPQVTTANGGTAAPTGAASANIGLSSAAVNMTVAGGLVAGNSTLLLSSAANQYISIEANP